MSAPRIAIGGFLHETNTFGPSKATYDDFVTGGGAGRMMRGAEIVGALRDVNAAISGVIRHGEACGWELVPTLYCLTSPSAHVTEDAFERISDELVDRITKALPLDGVFLDLHGAMVAEHVDDGEGELLSRIRAKIGHDIPVVASLDLHGNVTQRMFDQADLLETFRTYPHVDMAETGLRAAASLERMLSGERPDKAYRVAPYLTAIAWQCTSAEPARRLYDLLREMTSSSLEMSFNMGFPAADFPECQMSVMAYGLGAAEAADSFMAEIEAAEPEFKGKVYEPEECVREAMRRAADPQVSGPVVIADTQDNPGAGADSNTTGMIRAMLALGAKGAIGNIYDPEAAKIVHAAGEGATVSLFLGGQSGTPGDEPFEGEFVVERLSDGRFEPTGPVYRGRDMNLGPSAALRIGDLRIALVSEKSQMADLAMFRQVGIEPEKEPILIVKSSVHFRGDFEPIASSLMVCKSPGPMAVDPADLPWTRLRPGIRIGALGPAFGT